MVCGVYALVSVTGDLYIGSSMEIRKRLWNLGSKGRRGVSHSPKLQEAYDKGPMASRVLLICRPEDRKFYEQLCIDHFKPTLNTSPTADVSRMSPEGLERLRKSKIGKSRPDMVGRNNPNYLGHPISKDQRKKISEHFKAYWTPERRAQKAEATRKWHASRKK